MKRHVLLTGPPGCGKTTVIRKLAAELSALDLRVRGFWTEETRARGVRTGFRIETVRGASGMLADAGAGGPHRVGRYRVNLPEFEAVAVREIEEAVEDAAAHVGALLLIDEIGKMELLSARFRRAVGRAFCEASHVIATIMQRPNQFADALKSREEVRLIGVSARNRERLPGEIMRELLGTRTARPDRLP